MTPWPVVVPFSEGHRVGNAPAGFDRRIGLRD